MHTEELTGMHEIAITYPVPEQTGGIALPWTDAQPGPGKSAIVAKQTTSNPQWKPKEFQREDLVERVSDHLREEIVTGSFKAGENLPSEAELAEAYGVSRRVIRETMRILRALGLVEINQGKRPKVLPVTPDAAILSMQITLRRTECSFAHLYEVRRPIELEAVRLAAQRATPQDIAEIGKILDDYTKASDHGQLGQYDWRMRTDIDFHTRIALASGNPAMGLVYGAICQIFWQFYQQHREFMLKMIERNVQTGRYIALEHHQKIFQAISEHKPQKALKAAKEHLDTSVFMMTLESDENPGANSRPE